MAVAFTIALMIRRFCFLLPFAALSAMAFEEKGATVLHPMPEARFEFGGEIGRRVEANVDQWLLRAPRANPGILEMFRQRDRQPQPRLVPWAGEFAGKYLISAVQAMRLSQRADLREAVLAFVQELISAQDTDGYLGPFPKSDRLLGNWDLWGHYHVLAGLLLWHEFSQDAAALQAARRIGDLVCATYAEGKRRPLDAGSPEMNLAMSHGLALLHEATGEARYWKMCQEFIKDWERAGDYWRTGVRGVPFYQTPSPRWESLHDVQALFETWRITATEEAKTAFSSHWRTIREFDRRNSGAFSGGEQATGNVWSPTAIETCCTVAWMALSVDELRLHGEPTAADELELSTFNGGLAAQHPSGSWWTYNTPMDGSREASAHSIVFQARAGTPELNCCSVNGPRVLGMLADWAVMRNQEGLAVNYLGPMKCEAKLADGSMVAIQCESNYPISGQLRWRVKSGATQPWTLRLRIPGWAREAVGKAGGAPEKLPGGHYWDLRRVWKDEQIELDLPMAVRSLVGQQEATGKVSIYRGPLLLAYDQRFNSFDETAIPPVEPQALEFTSLQPSESEKRWLAPWLLVELKTSGGSLRLCDFASAGNSGTRYRTWLKVKRTVSQLTQDGLAIADDLAGSANPKPGQWLRGEITAAAEKNGQPGTAVQCDGEKQRLIYQWPDELGENYSLTLWARLDRQPEGRMGQLFSAWAGIMDDPLRLTVQNGQVTARIEAGQSFSTPGIALRTGEWRHFAVVKEADRLRLYINGKLETEGPAPIQVVPATRTCALGGNPEFSGDEFLAGAFAKFRLWGRALSAAEVAAAAK